MAIRLKGGKTPPRVLEDLKLYNPQRLPNSQYNVLTQLPPPFGGSSAPRKSAKGACGHTWAHKPRQSPALDLSGRPEGQTGATAAVCATCRMHVKLQITYPSSSEPLNPCPSASAPLHHFIHVPSEYSGFARRFEDGEPEWWQALEHFRCTADTCGAELAVYTRSPRLNDDWVALLTGDEILMKRANAAISTDPERFEGVATPSAISVLGNLRSYLVNAMNGNDRKIMANNKKWMVSLGDECRDLLRYFGFEREGDEWLPPQPPCVATNAVEDELSIRIDDAISELTALLSTQTAEDRRANRVESSLTPATNEFRKLLACANYATKPGPQRINLAEDEEHPFYAGLGTVRDFNDSLMIYAYDQQQLVDPDNSPYYLQCLQGIAKGRESESLSTKAAIEESSGRLSLDDIRTAYEAFNFEFPSPSLTDDTIIGTFQSRIADAPRQEAELRRCLRIIGRHMNNVRIEQYASDTITSYEQALEWLGATADMNDEFIVTLYSVKVNDNTDSEPVTRQALEFISKQRGSEGLKSFLTTGELKETEMDPTQAYSRLGVSDRTAEDELVVSAFEVAVADAPSQRHELLRALKAVAKDRDSSLLLAMAGGADDTRRTDHKLGEWPVGLDNIGNTCYLNSLLQYFFTIKPLRLLVLNNKDFVMQIEGNAVQKKKVGSRQVTRREIERAQKFIVELGALFQDMISAPVSQITPKLELARLTMLNSSAEEDLRRNSILSATRPSLDVIAEGAAAQQREGGDAVIVESPLMERPTNAMSGAAGGADDVSSEDTLVDPPAPDEAMQVDSGQKAVEVFEDKENVSPTKSSFDRPRTPDRSLKPLAESSPSRVNEQDQSNGAWKTTSDEPMPDAASTNQAAPAPPSRAPPVPPRERPERKMTIREEEDLYRQQDVTEVIGNVLFQLQCAIKPDKIDASGEQIDLIKELFYGKMKTTTTNAEGKARVMEEFFSDLKINVHSGPQDLYAALDASLERRMVEVEGSDEAQFDSISQLPAILQFYPNRTGYDRQRATPFKVNHHLKFYETIYMDRYMDSADPRIQLKRTESWEVKEQLKSIQERRVELDAREKELDRHDTLELTARFIDQVAEADEPGEETVAVADPSLAAKVRQAAKDALADRAQLAHEEDEAQARLAAVWQDESLRTLPYRLQAVFIHRGLVTSGHYWVYIFDAPNRVWRKYNDGYVTLVADPESEIFGQEPGDRPATAMFLVYVRQNDEGALVETLHRAVSAEAEAEAEAAAVAAAAALVRVGRDEPAATAEPDGAMDGVELAAAPDSLLDDDGGWTTWAGEEPIPGQGQPGRGGSVGAAGGLAAGDQQPQDLAVAQPIAQPVAQPAATAPHAAGERATAAAAPLRGTAALPRSKSPLKMLGLGKGRDKDKG